MATQIGSGTGVLSTYIPDLTDSANIQTALKQLYYGTTAGTLSQTVGIYGALYTLYSGNPTLAGNVTITGNLTVNGTTTTINSTVLNVDDILIELGAVASPTDVTANGGGISLQSAAGNKTFTWSSTGGNWTSTENLSLATGKTYKINNADIISGSATALVVGGGASTSLALGNASGTITLSGALTAGTNTRAPIRLTAGTNLSTQSAGAIEFDTNGFYATPNATTGRGLIEASGYSVSTSGTSLGSVAANGNSTYSVFGPTNGMALAASTYYKIEAMLLITVVPGIAGGTYSATLSLGGGGTAVTFSRFNLLHSFVGNTTALTTAATQQLSFIAGTTTPPTFSVASSVSSTTTSYGRLYLSGTFLTNTAGNLTIRINGTTVSPATISTITPEPGSYIKITPLGGSSMPNVGVWA
jgi:hypothetical protein